MQKRVQIDKISPKAYTRLLALEKYLEESQLSKIHIHLIKIRASQINNCAFCIDMHTKEALKNGETNQRLFLLSAWRETNKFSEEEKVLFKITEEVTLIHQGGLSDDTYNKAIATFGENYFAQIIIAIAAINTWNRIAISTHKPF